jgi:hypothetical protein
VTSPWRVETGSFGKNSSSTSWNNSVFLRHASRLTSSISIYNEYFMLMIIFVQIEIEFNM